MLMRGGGGGLVRRPRPGAGRRGIEGLGSFWKKIKGAAKSVATAPAKVLRKAGAGVVVDAANKVGRTAASYATPVLAKAAAEGAAAGCSALGIPGALCRGGGEALGKAAGAALAKAVGVPQRSLPVDPIKIARGDTGELTKLGNAIAAKAGVSVSAREAVFLAVRKSGLPPEVTASARGGL